MKTIMAVSVLTFVAAAASAGAKSPDECRQENAHLSGSELQQAVIDCLTNPDAPLKQPASTKAEAESQVRANRSARESAAATVNLNVKRGSRAAEMEQPVRNRPAPASTRCYVGPRGGTYTITKSGRKNYGGC
jgi:hypothetical protein